MRGAHLAPLKRMQIKNGDLRLLTLLRSLCHCNILVIWADGHRCDALGVVCPGNELLRLLLCIEDDDIVAGWIKHVLFVQVAYVVLDVSLDAKAVTGGNGGPVGPKSKEEGEPMHYQHRVQLSGEWVKR